MPNPSLKRSAVVARLARTLCVMTEARAHSSSMYLAGPLCVLLAVVLLLSGCFYGNRFELEWDEEVMLPGGRVTVVHLKYSYQRLHQGFTPYGGTNLLRDSTMTLQTGGRYGAVTQHFKGFHPMFLGEHGGEWYAVLRGSYYAKSRNIPGQDWGELEGPYGQWAIKLVDGKWKPISMTRLPEAFQSPNILHLYGTAEDHAAFKGKRVTLEDKNAWLRKHPLGYSDMALTRPIVSSTRPDSLPMPALKGTK